jgi:hypothetical protein
VPADLPTTPDLAPAPDEIEGSISLSVPPPPPESETPEPLAERVLAPFQRFTHAEAAGGIVLLFNALLALAWANSPWGESYHHLWETKLTIGVPGFGLTESLHHWINDGLMAVFFFVVKPMQKLQQMRGTDPGDDRSDEARLLEEIRDLLSQKG